MIEFNFDFDKCLIKSNFSKVNCTKIVTIYLKFKKKISKYQCNINKIDSNQHKSKQK